MDKQEKQIREQMGELFNQMKGITAKAEKEERSVTKEEQEQWTALHEQITAKKDELTRYQKEQALENEFVNKKPSESTPVEDANPRDPEAAPEKKPSNTKAGEHEASTEEGLMFHAADVFRALTIKDASSRSTRLHNAIKPLIEAGHYKNFGIKNAVDGFNTLLDKDGGIFLPTSISDRIMQMEKEYGVFPQLSDTIPMSVGGGRQVFPNVLGELTFYAVNQGSEARASKFSFAGIALEEQKWMGWVPWTNEMGSAAGGKLMPIIMRKLAVATAKLKDDAAINGDGTSTYHNLKGLINRSDDAAHPEVRKSTALATHTSFETIDDEDFLKATLDVAPSIRNRGVFVLHPDWQVHLALIKATDSGIPMYQAGGPVSNVGGQWRIYGYPVYFTEVMPNTSSNAVDYGLFYVPEYFLFGDVNAMGAEQFNEASILASDGTTRIHLAAQDMSAIRVKRFFDFELSNQTLESNGQNLGAFTVLETANS